jgi:hypothetical protein
MNLRERLLFLFTSTRGLVLTAIALVSLVVVVWGTLSGPMAEVGLKDITVRLFGFDLIEAEREGRIIILYHSIAMAVVAVEVYFITSLLPMRKAEQAGINGLITVGYITSLIFGLFFAYFGHNWAFHGLFIFGQSLVFFSGIYLLKALWPWKREYLIQAGDYGRGAGGISMERLAFFVVAATTLISVLFGAVAGAFFGNGFEAFMAENVVREPFKTDLQKAVIGHLHIMLALIGVALALIVGKSMDFKGKLQKWAMPLYMSGSIVLSLGVWLLVPLGEFAHFIIYAGSALVLPGALLLVIFGWRKLIRDGLAEKGIVKANFGQRISALIRDPLKFGQLWQMVFMNFVVTFIGLFMAAELDLIRRWPAREEHILLTGHWHILAGVMATILLLYYADRIGLKGKVRQWFGWLVIIGSDVAFAAMTLYESKRLYVSESAQQPLVDGAVLVADVGMVVLLATLGVLMFWRLIDLFKSGGHWSRELAEDKNDEEVS